MKMDTPSPQPSTTSTKKPIEHLPKASVTTEDIIKKIVDILKEWLTEQTLVFLKYLPQQTDDVTVKEQVKLILDMLLMNKNDINQLLKLFIFFQLDNGDRVMSNAVVFKTHCYYLQALGSDTRPWKNNINTLTNYQTPCIMKN